MTLGRRSSARPPPLAFIARTITEAKEQEQDLRTASRPGRLDRDRARGKQAWKSAARWLFRRRADVGFRHSEQAQCGYGHSGSRRLARRRVAQTSASPGQIIEFAAMYGHIRPHAWRYCRCSVDLINQDPRSAHLRDALSFVRSLLTHSRFSSNVLRSTTFGQ